MLLPVFFIFVAVSVPFKPAFALPGSPLNASYHVTGAESNSINYVIGTGILYIDVGASFTNNSTGTINNFSQINNSSTINNSGTINNSSTGVIDNNGTGTFNNNSGGTISIYGGVINNGGTLNNSGVLDLMAGSSYNFSGGTLNNNADGTLIFRRNFTSNGTTSGTVNLNAGGTVENYATFTNYGGSPTNAGVFNNNTGGIFLNVDIFTNDGSLTNNGTFRNQDILKNNGTFNNNTDGILVNSHSFSNKAGGTLTNNGSFSNTREIFNNGTFNNNGTLINNGTVSEFWNYDTLINNGTITNSGTFINITGRTLTNAGTFNNNGTFDNDGTFTNNGTVKGTGTIDGNFSNDGILAPGNSIGTMNVTGNYTHNAGATYQVETNAAGQSDKLVVTGTATLNGGTVSVLAESGVYKMGTNYNYTILTAGSVVGKFANVTSNLAFLTPSLSYDPTNVYLLLTRNSTGFADVAATLNQHAVASGLDRASPTAQGDMSEVINNLLGLSGQGARSAYDQMGGLSHASLTEAASFSVNRYIGVLSGRMGGCSTGGTALSDADNILLAFNENTGSDAGNMLLAAINGTRENGGMKENGMSALPRGLWAKGYGSIGERRGDEISTKYDYRGGGLIVGFDRKLSERLLLGAAAGYSYTKVNMNSLNDDGRVASYQGSLYGAYNIDPWYVNGLIAYGYNRYDTTRNIVFGGIARVAHANYGGHSLSGYAETGYRIKTNAVDIIPMASIQAGSLWRNAFTESDAEALDLNADSDRTSSFIGSLGVKLRKEYKTKIGSLTPEVRVRWLHEFVNSDYALNASFAYTPASTFSVRGDSARRDSASVGAGLNWEIDRNFGLALTYDATLSGDRTEHGGTAGIRIRW